MRSVHLSIIAAVILVNNLPLGSSETSKNVDTSSCHIMTKTELALMPGWEVLKDLVKSEYSEYKDFFVNWKEQPGSDAFVCAEGQQAKFGPIKEGECKKQTSSLQGLLRTEGIVATSIYSGFEASSQVAVTQSSAFGVDLTVGIEVELFSVKLGTKFSVSTTVTNTKSTSERKTSSSAVMSTVRIKSVIGETCSIKINSQTCSFTSDGSLPVLGTGYVWFTFDRKIKGKRRVVYKLEDVLTKVQRSVPIPLSVSINTKAHGDFESNCECVDDECLRLRALAAKSNPADLKMVVDSGILSFKSFIQESEANSKPDVSQTVDLSKVLDDAESRSKTRYRDEDQHGLDENPWKRPRLESRSLFNHMKENFMNSTMMRIYRTFTKPDINADSKNTLHSFTN